MNALNAPARSPADEGWVEGADTTHVRGGFGELNVKSLSNQRPPSIEAGPFGPARGVQRRLDGAPSPRARPN